VPNGEEVLGDGERLRGPSMSSPSLGRGDITIPYSNDSRTSLIMRFKSSALRLSVSSLSDEDLDTSWAWESFVPGETLSSERLPSMKCGKGGSIEVLADAKLVVSIFIENLPSECEMVESVVENTPVSDDGALVSLCVGKWLDQGESGLEERRDTGDPMLSVSPV
jgi:hypothetical protein